MIAGGWEVGSSLVSTKKQVSHWASGALDDWETAEILLVAGKTRQCLFFAHLALEKALKAHVCRATNDLAPRIHNLARLARLSTLPIEREDLEVLARMNEFSIEGRYPEASSGPPGARATKVRLDEAKEVFQWLQERL